MNKKLEQIGLEMARQDNRATQYVLFVVQELVERVVPDEMADRTLRKDDKEDWMCAKCKKKNESGTAPDYCFDCDPDCFYSVQDSWEFNLQAGVFLTAKACEEHIKINSYHYNKGRVYGVSAWRNPEMQEVMKHLIKDCAGKEIPNHYE